MDILTEVKDTLTKVAPLVSRAKALRDRALKTPSPPDREGLFREALRRLQEAIQLLEAARRAIESQGPDMPDNLSKNLQEVAQRLANCYGMQGGIYRRMGQEHWGESLECYRKGYAVEKEARYGIVDSYNLTNTLVMPLLINPESLRDPNTADGIKAAVSTVADQIEHKGRRGQWWAWADLGLLALLHKQPERARAAYEQYQGAGARAEDYDSTIEVLDECSKQLRDTAPTLADSINEEIAFLQRSKPAR